MIYFNYLFRFVVLRETAITRELTPFVNATYKKRLLKGSLSQGLMKIQRSWNFINYKLPFYTLQGDVLRYSVNIFLPFQDTNKPSRFETGICSLETKIKNIKQKIKNSPLEQ